MNTLNTPLPTVPQIAEMLAEHIRKDNDAPRFIVESILPLIKMEFSSVSEALAAPDMIRDAESDFISITASVSTTRRKVLELAQVIGSSDRDIPIRILDEAHRRWIELLGEFAHDLDKVLGLIDGRDV
jgi:hypothetical protein